MSVLCNKHKDLALQWSENELKTSTQYIFFETLAQK